MARKRFIENENIALRSVDVSKWPMVLIDNLTAEDRELFSTRKKAVEMYMKNEVPITKIKQETSLSEKEIRRLVKRCLELDSNGQICGFKALIPYKRLSNYNKKNLPNIDSNKTGSFSLLLKTYPTIKELIDNSYLKRNQKDVTEPIISIKYLHKKILESCRSLGILTNQYPFNTKHLAKRSLERYLKKLEALRFAEAAKRYGNDAARHSRTTGIGEQNHPMIVRPFQQVQFDGHRIDTSLSIVFHTPEGDEIVKPMERIWILVIIDVATRVILGYHLSLNKEYTASDVMKCVQNAVTPWHPKEFTIPGLKYSDSGGFASGQIKDTQWGVWDEFCYDNGKSNLSNLVTERLKNLIGCSINAGPVSMPERRGLIECFFHILEENGYHRLPCTTGSHPNDPLRKDPEEAAVKYRISFNDLEQLTEILIANYNGTPHSGINYLTPLEAMKQRIERGMDVRQMTIEQQNEAAFLSLKAQRIVHGDIKKGRRPYIEYEGVKYRNDVLSFSSDLIGTKLDLLVNIDDLRILRAFLPDGSELGYLTATGKWSLTKHSLKVRKEINSLRNKKFIHFTSSEDPIQAYQRYLEIEAKDRKKFRNKLVDLKRSTGKTMKKDEKPDRIPVENCEKDLVEKKGEQIFHTPPINDESLEQSSIRRIKRTIIY